MVRCDEFYKKFKKEGNFCGLNARTVQEIKRYLITMDDIEKRSIERIEISETAARPIAKLRKDEEAYDEAIKQVVALAATKKAEGKEPTVTAPEVVEIIHCLKSVQLPKLQVDVPSVPDGGSPPKTIEAEFELVEEKSTVQTCIKIDTFMMQTCKSCGGSFISFDIEIPRYCPGCGQTKLEYARIACSGGCCSYRYDMLELISHLQADVKRDTNATRRATIESMLEKMFALVDVPESV